MATLEEDERTSRVRGPRLLVGPNEHALARAVRALLRPNEIIQKPDGSMEASAFKLTIQVFKGARLDVNFDGSQAIGARRLTAAALRRSLAALPLAGGVFPTLRTELGAVDAISSTFSPQDLDDCWEALDDGDFANVHHPLTGSTAATKCARAVLRFPWDQLRSITSSPLETAADVLRFMGPYDVGDVNNNSSTLHQAAKAAAILAFGDAEHGPSMIADSGIGDLGLQMLSALPGCNLPLGLRGAVGDGPFSYLQVARDTFDYLYGTEDQRVAVMRRRMLVRRYQHLAEVVRGLELPGPQLDLLATLVPEVFRGQVKIGSHEQLSMLDHAVGKVLAVVTARLPNASPTQLVTALKDELENKASEGSASALSSEKNVAFKSTEIHLVFRSEEYLQLEAEALRHGPDSQEHNMAFWDTVFLQEAVTVKGRPRVGLPLRYLSKPGTGNDKTRLLSMLRMKRNSLPLYLGLAATDEHDGLAVDFEVPESITKKLLVGEYVRAWDLVVSEGVPALKQWRRKMSNKVKPCPKPLFQMDVIDFEEHVHFFSGLLRAMGISGPNSFLDALQTAKLLLRTSTSECRPTMEVKVRAIFYEVLAEASQRYGNFLESPPDTSPPPEFHNPAGKINGMIRAADEWREAAATRIEIDEPAPDEPKPKKPRPEPPAARGAIAPPPAGEKVATVSPTIFRDDNEFHKRLRMGDIKIFYLGPLKKVYGNLDFEVATSWDKDACKTYGNGDEKDPRNQKPASGEIRKMNDPSDARGFCRIVKKADYRPPRSK